MYAADTKVTLSHYIFLLRFTVSFRSTSMKCINRVLPPPPSSVSSKKSPNIDKSCPKKISLEKLEILTPLQKLPNNVGDLGKLIVTKGFEKLAKVQ